MFAYGFSPGPIKQADAAQLSLMARQLAGLMQPIVTGSFGMVRAADGRPIIYSIPTSGTGSGTISVCGAPVAPPLVTGNECPPCGTLDVVTLSSIQGLYFEPCDFQVTATNLCGGTAGAGSGSSGNNASRAARIQLTGKTETVDIPYRLVFCPTDCTILIQYQYECFRRGLYIGRWFDPPVSCGSGSGGSGSGGA